MGQFLGRVCLLSMILIFATSHIQVMGQFFNIVYDLLINVHRFFICFIFKSRQRIRGGSEPRLELFFRLEVNKVKARARSSLNSQSSNKLFCRLEVGSKGLKLFSKKHSQ